MPHSEFAVVAVRAPRTLAVRNHSGTSFALIHESEGYPIFHGSVTGLTAPRPLLVIRALVRCVHVTAEVAR